MTRIKHQNGPIDGFLSVKDKKQRWGNKKERRQI
jgi:hypothetical protein